MNWRGEAQKRAQAERFARYSQLRDEGTLPIDAAREIGLATSAAGAYERSYREARGMPRRRPGHGGQFDRRRPG